MEENRFIEVWCPDCNITTEIEYYIDKDGSGYCEDAKCGDCGQVFDRENTDKEIEKDIEKRGI